MSVFRKSDKIDVATRAIITLLTETPEDWAFDQHYAKHIGGAHIWIANGAWAADVNVPGIGLLFERLRACRPTASHKAIWAAIQVARRYGRSEAMRAYAVMTGSLRARRVGQLTEDARRLQYESGSLAVAAKEAGELAAAKLAQAATLGSAQ